ncbi:hypothetical protein H9P43_009186 [Blastocladiella emersonii ATCC 22665]|nr:hypothetical protein H9P43_009186 [Blastocladiella emersonii ATCC 22665]
MQSVVRTAAYAALGACTVAGAVQVAVAASLPGTADAAVITSGALSRASIVFGCFTISVSSIAQFAAFGKLDVAWNRTAATVLAVLALANLVVAAVALNELADVDGILDGAWQRGYDWYPAQLREVQTRIACCGFRTMIDRAIPRLRRDDCIQSREFGYRTPCFPALSESYRSMQQWLGNTALVVAGILMCTALLVLSVDQRPMDGYEQVETDSMAAEPITVWPASPSSYPRAASLAQYDGGDDVVANQPFVPLLLEGADDESAILGFRTFDSHTPRDPRSDAGTTTPRP